MDEPKSPPPSEPRTPRARKRRAAPAAEPAPAPEAAASSAAPEAAAPRSRAGGPPGTPVTAFDPHDTAQLLEAFRARYPFPLDAFQEAAIADLARDESVLVAAPTGTGKTVVAEFGVFRAHARGWRVIYTTPIKALSNQKFRDLREQYGDSVGLLTGDIVENREGSILVMTTEVLRNMLLQTPSELWGVGCIIFDEIHYLADKERGTTWEESIIMCPPEIQLACLSATISNAEEVAAWISRTHGPIHLVTHSERAVPLSYFYFLDGELVLVIDAAGTQVADFPNVGGEVRRRTRNWGGAGSAEDDTPPRERPEPTPREVVESLERRAMLPAIYFLFSRRDCEAAADLSAMMRLRTVHDPATRARIEGVLATFLARLSPEDRALEQVRTILYLARRGLGFHHAGLLPILKQLVEELFSQGLMRVVFATDTLALGINMPARTVVVGRMSKWDGVSRRPLLPNEFQQMAGRAGRRGIDPQGYVVVPYSPWVTFDDALGIATGPLLPVESAFTVRYNTILNLWNPPAGDRVLAVMRHSLLQFQQSRRVLELEEGIAEWDRAIAEVPLGCLIGLPAGEDLLSEYEALGRAVQTGRDRVRKLAAGRDRLAARRTVVPWARPDRETLRRLLRVYPVGGVVHLEGRGWAVYLGPRPGSAGLFWLGDRVHLIGQYSAIDYVPPEHPTVRLPADLSAVADQGIAAPADEAGVPVSQEARAWMREQLAGIDLPDLEQWILTHQATQSAELDAQLEQFATQLTEAEEYVRRVAAEERGHACATCPVRKQHRHNRRERGRLEGGREEARAYLEERRRYEDTRLQMLLDGLVAVLQRFYYLTGEGEKTAKATQLMDIFDTNALLISESLEAGYLDDLAPSDLAEVFSWFAYDRDIEFRNHNLLPGNLVQLRRRLDELQREIFMAERRYDLFLTPGYNPYFYGIVRTWCRGASMADILSKVELSEGDIVMAMTKTLDIMRQVREMLGRQHSNEGLYVALLQADDLLRRGVVEMVNSVGFVGREAAAPVAEEAAPEGTGFADIDRMLGRLANPELPPPSVPPPDTGMMRPHRPQRPGRTGPVRGGRPPGPTGRPRGGRDWTAGPAREPGRGGSGGRPGRKHAGRSSGPELAARAPVPARRLAPRGPLRRARSARRPAPAARPVRGLRQWADGGTRHPPSRRPRHRRPARAVGGPRRAPTPGAQGGRPAHPRGGDRDLAGLAPGRGPTGRDRGDCRRVRGLSLRLARSGAGLEARRRAAEGPDGRRVDHALLVRWRALASGRRR